MMSAASVAAGVAATAGVSAERMKAAAGVTAEALGRAEAFRRVSACIEVFRGMTAAEEVEST